MTEHLTFIPDALSNAAVHGTQMQGPVNISLTIGECGIIYGFNDHGDFYGKTGG